MTNGTVIPRRLLASVISLACTAALVSGTAVAASLDPELVVTLELRKGYIDYEAEPDTFHLFDEENQPLAIEIIDGCAINDHYWIFAAGLSGIPIQISVRDQLSGEESRQYLPAYELGKPVDAVFDPAALPICNDDVRRGGLPRLDATATFTSAKAGGEDGTATISLLSDGAERGYRRLIQADQANRILGRGSPVVAVDESPDFDRLYLLTEGRTPHSVEGVVFRGGEGMLPARGKFERALRKITDARVRRAFEAAKSGKVPAGIIEDLGLRKVERVHHAELDFETPGSTYYLGRADWFRKGTTPIEPPSLVEERFTVELVTAAGERTTIPLVGPVVGSEQADGRWDYRTDGTQVQIVDACELSGSYWIWAAALTEEPLELVVTETATGTSETFLLWTERRSVSRVADTTTLASCAG